MMMKSKFISLFGLTAIVGLSSIPINARILGGNKQKEAGGNIVADPSNNDESFDFLLEEVITDSGDLVGFYEPEPGLIVVKSSSRKGDIEESAIAKYKKERKSGQTDVSELYEHLTGNKPRGRVEEALARIHLQENEDTDEGQELWTEPPAETNDQEFEGEDNNDRRLNKSKKPGLKESDFKDALCGFEFPFSSCMTKQTNTVDITTPNYRNFIQAVYTEDGNVRQTAYYWKCPLFSCCYWSNLGSTWVAEGYLLDVMFESSGSSGLYFRGVVDYASGDKYHVVTYAW